MIKATPAASPVGRREHASIRPGILPDALQSLELHIARLEEWGVRFGRDFDPAGTHKLAIEELRVVADGLRGRTAAATAPSPRGDASPLVVTGQGAFRREIRGDQRTGRLNVQG